MEAPVSEEADQDGDAHDDANGSFNGQGACSYGRQTLGAADCCKNAKNTNLKDDNKTEEKVRIFATWDLRSVMRLVLYGSRGKVAYPKTYRNCTDCLMPSRGPRVRM